MERKEYGIERLKKVIELQCSHGNWNYDSYMHGMANGLILALSCFDDKDPSFLDAPKEWICDKPDITPIPVMGEENT